MIPGGKLASFIEDNLKMGKQPHGSKMKVIEGNGFVSSLALSKPTSFLGRNAKGKIVNVGV